MKTLIIYIKDSFEKFPGLYKSITYEITDYEHLKVNKRNEFTGEETLMTHFRNWDWFQIEEDYEE